MSSHERSLPLHFQEAEHYLGTRQSGIIIGDASLNTLYGYFRENADTHNVRIVNMNFGTGVGNFASLISVRHTGKQYHFEDWKIPPYLILRHIDVYFANHDRDDDFIGVNKGLHECVMRAEGVLVTLQSPDLVSFSELADHEYYATSFEEDLMRRIQMEQGSTPGFRYAI